MRFHQRFENRYRGNDGEIHVQEAANGNLHLKSHVFTQIYSAKLTAAEESIDSIENATEPETDPVTEPETDPVTEPETDPETDPVTEPETQPETEPESNAPNGDTTNAPESEANTDKLSDDTSKSNDKDVDNSLITWILIAIMIVAVLCAAGFIVIKVRK